MVSEGKNIVEMYTDEEQQTMSGILPEEYELNKLQVSEFVLLLTVGYSEEFGDVTILLNVPGEYDEGDTVIAMITLLTASDTEMEAEVIWILFTVNIVEGELQIVFDSITLTYMEAHGAAYDSRGRSRISTFRVLACSHDIQTLFYYNLMHA